MVRELIIPVLGAAPARNLINTAADLELTGAYIAISNALKQAAGQQKFDEFNGPLWHAAGTGAKEFADTFGLPTETAG